MPLWRPDPTFYPSARMAMQAPSEKVAFVAMINPQDNGRPDALGVVDVDRGMEAGPNLMRPRMYHGGRLALRTC